MGAQGFSNEKNYKKIAFPALAVILALIIAYAVFGAIIAKQNVFAEMLYSGTNGTYFGNEFIDIAPGAKASTMNGGQYLLEDEDLYVTIGRHIIKPDSIRWSFSKHFESNEETEIVSYVTIAFKYDAFTKILTYEPVNVYFRDGEPLGEYSNQKENVLFVMERYNLTREDIREYQEYALYQVLFPYWLEKNAKTSRFSMENLGEFIVIDNTFEIIGTDWDL